MRAQDPQEIAPPLKISSYKKPMRERLRLMLLVLKSLKGKEPTL